MKIQIKGIGYYVPDNIVDNQYYIDKFKKEKGIDITDFLKDVMQKERRIVENEEDNTLTLGLKAARRALENAKIKGSDIDLIVFCSQFPEYFVPAQSQIIHSYINGKHECQCFDMNCNCASGVIALDTVVTKMLLHKQFNKVLIVLADYSTKHMCSNHISLYSYCGDAGVGIVLEKKEDGKITSNEIDMFFYTDTSEIDICTFPQQGLSHIYRNEDKNNKKAYVKYKQKSDLAEMGMRDISNLLSNNHLKPNDIKLFCVSQALKPNVLRMRQFFEISEEKMPYVGDKYGYTGVSSPFLVLAKNLLSDNETNKVKDGDKIIFWSVGSNFSSCGILFEF